MAPKSQNGRDATIYPRSSKKSATASLLRPGDQEPGVRLTVVTPEPNLHLMTRAGEEDKSDDLVKDEGETHLVIGAGTGEVELQ